MAPYVPPSDKFPSLKDKVVIITGGNRGIGGAAVKFFASYGAKVISIDLRLPEVKVEDVDYMEADVTNYASLLKVFDFALSKYGKVDIGIANAGIMEPVNMFGLNIDLEAVKQEPNLAVIDVNVKGPCNFARIAMVYMQQNRKPGDDKALIMTSSVAGFTHTPGLYVYGGTKHAVIGLMRPLARCAELNVRVNCVCPWTTESFMTDRFMEDWIQKNFSVNKASDVAAMYAGLAIDGESNGKAIYAEGGRGWDVEEGIYELGSKWLGEEPWSELKRGQQYFADNLEVMTI